MVQEKKKKRVPNRRGMKEFLGGQGTDIPRCQMETRPDWGIKSPHRHAAGFMAMIPTALMQSF